MVLDSAPLYYPEHRDWLWTYCVYLGPYTASNKNYDLGIYLTKDTVSAAIAFGAERSEYFSGPIDIIGGWENNPYYKETYRRAMILKLHPTMCSGCIGGITQLRIDYRKFLNSKYPYFEEEAKKIEDLFAEHNVSLFNVTYSFPMEVRSK